MWSLVLICTAFSSLVAFICYVIALHKEYNAQKREIAQLKETIKQLTNKSH